MKIAIYGAGAIGGYLGTQLALAGHDMTLIDQGPHLQAIKDSGLRLLIDGEERHASNFLCTDEPAEAGPQDHVIVALKAHQAAESLLPLLGPETSVVTAMNGIPWWYFYKSGTAFENHHLASVDPGGVQWKQIGPERAIGCVVYPAMTIESPGVIRHIHGNKFTLGEPGGKMSERCLRLSDAIKAAGLQAPVRSNIRDDVWKNLWGNFCFNPISALTGVNTPYIKTILSLIQQRECESGNGAPLSGARPSTAEAA